MLRLYVLVIALLLATPAHSSEGVSLVERFIEAYNQQDVEQMVALSSDEIHWMMLLNDELIVEASSSAELREAMEVYFDYLTTARSELLSISGSGDFVYTLEKAYWQEGGESRHQCSMAVYQIEATKIKNVWYFDSHPCD